MGDPFPPPSGEQFVLHDGDQEAVVTEVGATLRAFSIGGRPVVDGFAADQRAVAGTGQVLAPWPNRLGDGAYTFEGRTGSAALNEPERSNSVHGLVRWLPWVCSDRSDDAVELACAVHPQPAYPWDLRLRVRYGLGAAGLVVTTTAVNVGDGPAPFGIGFHPYLTVGTATVDTAVLRVPARRRLTTDARGLPTGDVPVDATDHDFTTARAIGPLELDTCFTDLMAGEDGRTVVTLSSPSPGDGRTVELVLEGDFRHVMVFTGDTREPAARRRSVAVEPMTCPPDALRSGVDLIRLAPGERWTGTWGLRARA